MSDGIRVAVVIGELHSHCGPSVNGIRLARALHEVGHSVDLLHQTGEDKAGSDACAFARDGGIALPYCHPLSPALGVAFARLVREREWEAAIFTVPTSAALLSPIARLAGCGTIFVMSTSWNYNAAWIRGALRLSCRLSIDHVVGVSGAILDDMVRHGARHPQSSVIYNGVPVPDAAVLDTWRGEVLARLQLPAGAPVLGTCGRLDRWKRPIRIMEACAELAERGLDFSLIVVGDGPERGPMTFYCREQGIDDRVRFVGWQDNVFPFLAAMDFFVFHSPDEGFPTVVTEAARIGLPLVLSDLPALHEVFANGTDALYAPADDIEAYADCMQRLCEEAQLREELGMAARARAEEHLSVRAMRERYEELICKVKS